LTGIGAGAAWKGSAGKWGAAGAGGKWLSGFSNWGRAWALARMLRVARVRVVKCMMNAEWW